MEETCIIMQMYTMLPQKTSKLIICFMLCNFHIVTVLAIIRQTYSWTDIWLLLSLFKRTHTGQRPFFLFGIWIWPQFLRTAGGFCTLGLWSNIRRAISKRNHAFVHTVGRTAIRRTLCSHLASHGTGKTFKCTLCNKFLTFKASLTRHKLTHRKNTIPLCRLPQGVFLLWWVAQASAL